MKIWIAKKLEEKVNFQVGYLIKSMRQKRKFDIWIGNIKEIHALSYIVSVFFNYLQGFFQWIIANLSIFDNYFGHYSEFLQNASFSVLKFLIWWTMMYMIALSIQMHGNRCNMMWILKRYIVTSNLLLFFQSI